MQVKHDMTRIFLADYAKYITSLNVLTYALPTVLQLETFTACSWLSVWPCCFLEWNARPRVVSKALHWPTIKCSCSMSVSFSRDQVS